MKPTRPASRLEFEVAIICALIIEADAVKALFDQQWDEHSFNKASEDPNAYSIGSIGRHNIVLAYMPSIGKASSAAVAAHCRNSFPNIKLALVVGICGAVPFVPNVGAEIILGDILISKAVVQYDLGQQLPECFIRKDTLLESLSRPNTEIRALLVKLEGIHEQEKLINMIAIHLAKLQKEPRLQAQYPGAIKDKLFQASYRHLSDKKLCEECGCHGELVSRQRLEQKEAQRPVVHFGIIASGDIVMKSGEERDSIAKQEGIIGFEMESAGVWDTFPCIVIKGACDYADSHKTKKWQRYAAATAAACAKALLEFWAPSPTETNTNRAATECPDAWIRNNHYTRDRLKIERISGDELPMDQCYINLAIIEQPRIEAAQPKESDKIASPFSLSARLKVETLGNELPIKLPALFNLRKTLNSQMKVPRRILIRGRAGVGKTTLCKKIVYDFTYGSMWNKLFDRVLWVPLRNLKWTKPCNFEDLFHLEYFSLSLQGNNHARELSRSLSRALDTNNSRTLFILDGLDEVQDLVGKQNRQSLFFSDLLKQPNVIVTTRPHAILPAGFKKPDLELETIGFYPNQVQGYLERVVEDQSRVKEIQLFLQKHPLLQSLVRIPIQLDSLCLIWSENFMTTHIPETMTAIYQAIVDRLWRKDILRLEEYDKTPFVRTAEPLEINRDIEAENQLLESLAFSGLHSNVVEFQSKHRGVVCERFQPRTSGLSVYETLGRLSFFRTSDPSAPVSHRSYHFLHLTFQEFFAAQYFVKQWIANKDLQYLDFNRGKSEVMMDPRAFFRLHKYDARYHVFWRFVAGLLAVEEGEEIQCFFEIIEEEPVDLLGPTHQRLVMHCLSEVDASTELPKRSEIEARISEWLLFECALTERSFLATESECPDEALHRALRLGYSRGRAEILGALAYSKRHLSGAVLAVVTELLEDADSSVRSSAAYALGGQANLSEAMVTKLIKTEDHSIRLKAADGLGGQENLSGVVVVTLAALLKDEDSDVRFFAIRALGSRINLPEAVIKALIPLLKDKNSSVRSNAAQVLGRQANLSEAIIAALVMLFKDKDSSVRSSAASALCGQVYLSKAVVEALLKNKNSRIRSKAAKALGSQANLSEARIAALVMRFKDKDSSVRSSAASALRGQVNLSEIVVTALTALLKDKDLNVRCSAASTLGYQANPSKAVVMALAALLKGKDCNVRSNAAEALGRQSNLSQVIIMELMMMLLKDEHPDVKSKASEALSHQANLSKAVITALAALLMSKDLDSQYIATKALSSQANLSETIATTLAKLLKAEDWEVRSNAAKALGRQANLSKAVVATLAASLADKDWNVRSNAAEALGRQSNLLDIILKSIGLLTDPEKQPVLASSTFDSQLIESFYGVLLYRSFFDQSTLYIDYQSCIIDKASGLRTASLERSCLRDPFLTALKKGRQLWNPRGYELWGNF